MANDFYTDKELKELFGLRQSGNALFEPSELGWVCPKDKAHGITWSEFEKHIWCYVCEKDYFSLLCPKEMNPDTTPTILKEETEKMKPVMDRWILERYKKYKEGR